MVVILLEIIGGNNYRMGQNEKYTKINVIMNNMACHNKKAILDATFRQF